MKVLTEITDGNGKGGIFVICPKCGQKLTVIRDAEGRFCQIIKCRRCRSYVSVETDIR